MQEEDGKVENTNKEVEAVETASANSKAPAFDWFGIEFRPDLAFPHMTEEMVERLRAYGQLAAQLGNPKATRAIGAANGRNPISVIVPCHRVIGSSGALTGFAGGLDAKAHLLRLEERSEQQKFTFAQ